MIKRLLLAVTTLGLASQGLFAQGDNPRAKPTDWEEINFEFNQAVLVDGFPGLLRLADLLKAHPDYKVTLTGNADQIGSNRYNDALSLRRANTVAQFLQKYGASANQVSVRGDGKKNLEVASPNVNARFMNRRVVIAVTGPNGQVISDGSQGLSQTVNDFENYTRAQLGKIDGILAELQRLEAEVRALNTAEIKQDTTVIRQDTAELKNTGNAIKRDTAELVQRPSPLTDQRTVEIAQSAANYALTQSALRNRKYSLIGYDIGPTFAPGRTGVFSADVFGKALIPFGNGRTADQPGTHGLQIDGDWVYFKKRRNAPDGQSDGIFDIGVVNRFDHVQLGAFAQFDYVSLNRYTGGAFLGAGVFTMDWLFNGGSIGVFGAKGFREYANISETANNPATLAIGGALVRPAYLRYEDQVGFHAIGMFKNVEIESSVAFKKRYAFISPTGTRIRYPNYPAATVKLSYSIYDALAVFAEFDQNTTIQTFNVGDRVVFGVEFGRWLRPRSYGTTQGVVPVSVPRPHYEILPR